MICRAMSPMGLGMGALLSLQPAWR
jgi:hypothetical protein